MQACHVDGLEDRPAVYKCFPEHRRLESHRPWCPCRPRCQALSISTPQFILNQHLGSPLPRWRQWSPPHGQGGFSTARMTPQQVGEAGRMGSCGGWRSRLRPHLGQTIDYPAVLWVVATTDRLSNRWPLTSCAIQPVLQPGPGSSPENEGRQSHAQAILWAAPRSPTRNCPPGSEIGLLSAENMSGFSLSLVMQQRLNDISQHDLGKNYS